MDEQRENRSSRTGEGHGQTSRDDWRSRLVRDAAVRAAAVRDTWERSYREARDKDAPPDRPKDAAAELSDLVAELRTTNELLRELVRELKVRR